jgi:hypothetical protein
MAKEDQLEGQQDFLDDHSPEKIEGHLFAFEQISEIEDKISVSFIIGKDNPLLNKLLDAFKQGYPVELTVVAEGIPSVRRVIIEKEIEQKTVAITELKQEIIELERQRDL